MSQLETLVHQFNFRPETYVHESWYADDWPAMYRQPTAFRTAGVKRLAAMLNAQHGLSHCYEFNFSSPARRLFLLPGDVLEVLATALGLLFFQSYVLDLAGAGRLAFLHDGFGRRLTTLVAVRCPSVAFAAVATLAEEVPFLSLPSLRLLCAALGRRMLLTLAEGEGIPVVTRTRLKYARSVPVDTRVSFSAEEQSLATELCLMCLIPEEIPAWDWLFY
ncbi:SctK family type III secretion system sorting platform protein [Herbaspirillum sp. RTI4]|uniref:SctK family type III secretion system sorting platform protein n=1 Tax=Herbaspirillum sp. RTI4 TaxID=3048640 RepID=UPI002AB52CD3|nr:SctK family type III secretion system sorting platform protein [Herbaspirillum sp. RTI4]MDY7577163.1 SctK family type III secretion system sorting platform protein [Herbaspirillum sp. RTI4]MEA9980453.1 SctK family type III secretion system sorting platform protein [Herbaspirillum sp. RTI4]